LAKLKNFLVVLFPGSGIALAGDRDGFDAVIFSPLQRPAFRNIREYQADFALKEAVFMGINECLEVAAAPRGKNRDFNHRTGLSIRPMEKWEK
jgi:hypothetical protein